MREAGEKDSQTVEGAAGQRDDARAFAIQPQAAEEGSKSKNTNTNREGQRDFGDAPTELFRQWNAENAPGVDRAQRDLQKNSGDYDDPAIPRSHDSTIAA